MHGGAARSGAQPGNRNRWRHGRFSRENVEGRALIRLSAALNALVDANLAVITAAGCAEHEQFDRLIAATEATRDTALAAGASYQRFLERVGRTAEADALAADLVVMIEPKNGQMKQKTNISSVLRQVKDVRQLVKRLRGDDGAHLATPLQEPGVPH